MKKLKYLLLLAIVTAVAMGTVTAAEGDKYINGTGGSDDYDGNSWETAYQTIQYGLDNVAEGGTVNIAEGTYTGTGNTNLEVKTNEVTIKGSGQDKTIIDGNGYQILNVESGEKVGVQDLTIQNGYNSIRNDGTLTLTRNTFKSNFYNYEGGAISNSGTLTVTDSIFKDNTAHDGGAISNSGTLTVTGSEFTNNNATTTGDASEFPSGGAIKNTGILTVTDSTFTGNTATYGRGGAIYNPGTLTIIGCTFTSNNADQGGAIKNHGTLTVTGSNFESNNAYSGGAIHSSGPVTATINDSIFTSNTATYGGGITNSGSVTVTGSLTAADSEFISNTAENGGAIYNAETGTVTITSSEFTSNSATYDGGGIFNGDTAEISGSIFKDNSATYDGGGAIYNIGYLTVSGNTFEINIAYFGGAINNNVDGVSTVTYSTFKGNKASNSGGAVLNAGITEITGSTFTSNIAGSNGGAIFNVDSKLTIKYSGIVDNALNDIYVNSGTVDARYNWWGTNFQGTNPLTIGRIAINTRNYPIVYYDPWLVLSITANPTSLYPGESSQITPDIYSDSNGEPHQVDAALYPANMPVEFTTNLGSFTGNGGSVLSTNLMSGTVTVGWNAGSTKGTANINAKLDDQTVTATVIVKNTAPVANAGGPYSEIEGMPITFDASGSSDKDGDTLQYRWDFNNDGTWDTAYNTNPKASYTWPDAYTGIVKVEVFDGELSNTATASVTVITPQQAINDINGAVQALPNTAFGKNPAQQKNNLGNMFNAVKNMINDSNYNSAIKKLTEIQSTINKLKLDVATKTELNNMINDLIASLKTLT